MRLPRGLVCILFLIGSHSFPIGNSDVEEEIKVKPAQKISAERILHLGKGSNRKVSQQDHLSLSNGDGDMKVPTQFRTKRSSPLHADYGPHNSKDHSSFAAGSTFDQSSTLTNAQHQTAKNNHNYPDIQPPYHQQIQSQYFQLPQAGYYYQNFDYNAYYNNPLTNLQYYNNDLQQSAYYDAYYQSQLSNAHAQPYYYQPQYLQGQQNAVHQPQASAYYLPQQTQYYQYQPVPYNSQWNANSYLPAQSQATMKEPNEILPLPAPSPSGADCNNQVGNNVKMGPDEDTGAFTAAQDGMRNGKYNVLGYHELIDALYDENNLENELGASAEYYWQQVIE